MDLAVVELTCYISLHNLHCCVISNLNIICLSIVVADASASGKY